MQRPDRSSSNRAPKRGPSNRAIVSNGSQDGLSVPNIPVYRRFYDNPAHREVAPVLAYFQSRGPIGLRPDFRVSVLRTGVEVGPVHKLREQVNKIRRGFLLWCTARGTSAAPDAELHSGSHEGERRTHDGEEKFEKRPDRFNDSTFCAGSVNVT